MEQCGTYLHCFATSLSPGRIAPCRALRSMSDSEGSVPMYKGTHREGIDTPPSAATGSGPLEDEPSDAVTEEEASLELEEASEMEEPVEPDSP